MRNIFTYLLLLTSLAAIAEDKSSQLDQLMLRYHDLEQFSGVALVIESGSTVLRDGYGLANIDWQIENTPETRFAVGSMTKSFTSLVIMQLVEQGKLDLDATISDYLLAYRPDTGSEITLRHLLTHTDGVPNYIKDTYFWQSNESGAPHTTAEFIARFCSGDLEFVPGSQYRYGNAGYSILGAIIEEVTGKRYGEAVAQQVTRPLHMQNTGQVRDDIVLEKRAIGYEVAIDGYRPAAPVYKPLFAAGSMYSTVDDLVLYDRALYDDKLISEAGKKALFESRDGAVDGTFAYGWTVSELSLGGAIESKRYIATSGQINGFNAIMVRIPDDEHLIILLNNTGETELSAMAENVLRILYGLAPNDVKPRLRDAFYQKLQRDSVDVAISFYRQQREEHPQDYIYFPWPLRILAGQLMSDGRFDAAIALLDLNLESNPYDARSFVRLGDAHLRADDVTTAIEYFRKALSMNSSNAYATNMLQRLETRK